MNLEKRYKDSDGNDCTIMQMVLREPEWAANRIQAGEDAIHKLQNTSSDSDYAKLPTINSIVDELNGGKNLGWTPEDVEPIVNVIKSIGNFA